MPRGICGGVRAGYLIWYLLYRPHGVLGVIILSPPRPSVSMPDSDGQWCFPPPRARLSPLPGRLLHLAPEPQGKEGPAWSATADFL